ncbi:MAG: CBS domain-containing protein [Actinomycetota bacterium]|nr:CBS domain-containing protein [Actinomycetota bacterium]
MRARDIADPHFPAVPLDGDALDAATLLAGRRLAGLVVTDGHGLPIAILPGSQVLNFMIPDYVQHDLALARVYDEQAADELACTLAGKTVRQLLPRKELVELEIVDGDATAMEVAAIMARMHSPVVAVVEKGRMLGAITVAALLDHVLPHR